MLTSEEDERELRRDLLQMGLPQEVVEDLINWFVRKKSPRTGRPLWKMSDNSPDAVNEIVASAMAGVAMVAESAGTVREDCFILIQRMLQHLDEQGEGILAETASNGSTTIECNTFTLYCGPDSEWRWTLRPGRSASSVT